MKKITVRSQNQEINLMLDFNQQIDRVFDKLKIGLSDEQLVVSLISNRVVDPRKTFVENNIDNNEILLIKEQNE